MLCAHTKPSAKGVLRVKTVESALVDRPSSTPSALEVMQDRPDHTARYLLIGFRGAVWFEYPSPHRNSFCLEFNKTESRAVWNERLYFISAHPQHWEKKKTERSLWRLNFLLYLARRPQAKKNKKSKICLNCYGRGWTEWTDGRGIRRGSTKLNQQILTSSGVWFHDCDQIWEGTSKAWLVKK